MTRGGEEEKCKTTHGKYGRGDKMRRGGGERNRGVERGGGWSWNIERRKGEMEKR